MIRTKLIRTMLLIAATGMATASVASEPAQPAKKGKDPNEKICETHGVLGSRLATRRVCATRAEWAERRQRERDIVDRTQTQRCSIDPATGFCGSQ